MNENTQIADELAAALGREERTREALEELQRVVDRLEDTVTAPEDKAAA